MGTVSWRKPGVAKAGVSGPPVPDNALDEGERLGETAEPHASPNARHTPPTTEQDDEDGGDFSAPAEKPIKLKIINYDNVAKKHD